MNDNFIREIKEKFKVNVQIESTIKTYSRPYFSTKHLQSAYFFATNSRQIENEEYEEDDKKEKASRENQSNVIASLFFIVSFLEATINEFFIDMSDPIAYPSEGTSDQATFAETWNFNISRESTIDKYQAALELVSCEKFKAGKQPYQDVKLITQLRNSIIHYEPEWIDHEKRHKFEKRLAKKFPSNKLTDETDRIYYPDKCLGFGCARWAIDSSLKFTDEFFGKINIRPSYEGIRKEIIW